MITGVRVFSPRLLRIARGSRLQKEIVDKANDAFTEQAYSSWETGQFEPTDSNKAVLVKILGVRYEDISEPFEAAAEIAMTTET